MPDTTAPRARVALLCAALALVLAGLAGRDAVAEGAPKIRSVNPAYGTRGGSVDVAIEGSNLFPAEDVSCSSPDVGVVVQLGSNDHKLVVRLTIPDSVVPGPVTLKVKTKNGAASTDRFVVRARVPVVSKVKPDSFRHGGTYEVTVTGTNLSFAGFETKVTTDAPMTAELLSKSTDKALVVRLVVPAATPPGPHPLTLETTDGKATASFGVTLAPPTVTGLAPATVARGAAAEMTFSGDTLDGTVAVVLAAPDAGLRVSIVGTPATKSVKVRVEAAPDAVPGPRLLVLQTPDGLGTAGFEVVVPAPRTLLVQPPGVVRGASVDVKATGEGLAADADLRFVPADPSLRIERAAGGAWKVTAAADARTGPRTLVAVTKQGAVAAPFHVGIRTPAVAGTSPADVAPGSEADLAFEGQDLSGATAALFGPAEGVAATPVPGTGALLHVKVAPDARPGPRHVLLSTPDGTAVAHFAVKGPAASAPSATALVPGRALRGRATKVVLSGINLRSSGDKAPEVAVSAPGGGALPARVVASTPSALTIEVSPPADAVPGGYAILVTTVDGTAAAALQVDPARPVLASATPSSASRPSEADVVLAGERLTAADGAAPRVTLVPAAGGTAVPVKVVSAEDGRVATRVALDPSLAPGPWLLVLETPEGGAALAFAVAPSPPSISSVAPASLGTPVVADLLVTGRNLLEPDGKAPGIQVARLGSGSAVGFVVTKAEAGALTLRVTTAPGTPPGPHVVLVRTADGLAAGVFTVSDVKPPRVSGIDQASAPHPATLLTTIRGVGLAGATEVAFAGKGVSATILSGATDEALPVRVSVAADAEAGPRAFTVTAPGGVAAEPSQVFTVK